MNPLLIAIVTFISLVLLGELMARVLVPILARRAVQKVLKDKTKLDPRVLENAKYGKIACDYDSLGITGSEGGHSVMLWGEVEEIHAFKKDLFTTDLICLAFKRAGKGEYYEVHEEMEGYHDLLEVLPDRLPKFTLDWIFDVASPAFETNHRIIWKKSTSTTEAAAGRTGTG